MVVDVAKVWFCSLGDERIVGFGEYGKLLALWQGDLFDGCYLVLEILNPGNMIASCPFGDLAFDVVNLFIEVFQDGKVVVNFKVEEFVEDEIVAFLEE